MRDILKRIFIGVAVGMALFFLKSEVFAATITPSTSKFDVRYTTLYCDRYDSAGSCIYDSWGTWNGQVNLGSTISPQSGISDSFNTIGITFSFSNDLVAGNTYNFVFKITLSPSTSVFADRGYNIISQNFNVPFVSIGTTNSNRSPDNVQSYAYSLRQDPSGGNVLIFSVSVTPQTNGKWISIYLRDNNYGKFRSYLDYLWEVNVTLSGNTVSYSESSNSYIQQTTQAVNNLILTVISGNNDMLDADAPASKDFNNDYSVTAYDQAESDISQYQNADVHNFLFDPNTWQSSFAVVWRIVEDFVFISNKVFGAITAILVLSFVGLVMGR